MYKPFDSTTVPWLMTAFDPKMLVFANDELKKEIIAGIFRSIERYGRKIDTVRVTPFACYLKIYSP